MATDFTENLLAYYELEETSGDVIDSSTNANHATNSGATRGVAGKNGFCFDFENTESDYIDADVIAPSLYDTDYSISFWIKFESFSGSDDVVGFSVGLIRYDSGANPNVLEFRSYADNVAVASGALATSTWYHFVMVKTATEVLAYQNGALLNSTADIGYISSGGDLFKIGSKNDGSQNYTDGLYDEFAVWTKALTADEVSELWNSGTGLFFDDNDFDGGDSGDSGDSATHNSGTVQGGPGTVGTRHIDKDYPYERGIIAGTTKHLVDDVDYDSD